MYFSFSNPDSSKAETQQGLITKTGKHEIFLFFRVFACVADGNYRTGVISGFRDITFVI